MDYTSVKNNVIRIFENLLKIKDNLQDSDLGLQIKSWIDQIEKNPRNCKTSLIDGFKKNEVSQSNLAKANSIIEHFKKILINKKETINLYSSFDGKEYSYDILDAFKKLSIEPISIQKKISKFGDVDTYNKLCVMDSIISDIIIFENNTLCDTLNNIVRGVFTDVKLVVVHEKNGYKPITKLNNIVCNRITSGCPRCKIYD